MTMTIEQFRATGSDCADLGARFAYESDTTEAGRVYAGDCYMVRCDDGRWMVQTWGHESWIVDSLTRAEEILYIYACIERPEDMAVPMDMALAIGNLLGPAGMVALSAFVAGHADDESLDDLCDTAPLVAEAYRDWYRTDDNQDAIDSLIGDVYEWANQNEFATDDTRSNGR